MAQKSLEERMKQLEERLEQAEETAQRARDVQEIQNLMSMHSYHYAALKRREEFEKYWAQKTPGVRRTLHGEVYEGLEAVRDYFCDDSDKRKMQALENVARWYPVEVVKENVGAGELRLHLQTTPVIEVAKDGKTAKGVWYSPGMIAGIGQDGKPQGRWMWEKYGVDFVKEDGKWKFWHMTTYYDFVIEPGRSFSEVEWPRVFPVAPRPLHRPTRMLPKGDPYERYHPTRVPQYMPVPPEPYDTFDEKDAY